jgi:hypothetical protein
MKKLKLNIFIIGLALNSIILCQWSNDPYVNTRVSYWGVSPKAAEDGSNGAFVTFNNFSYDLSFVFLQVLKFDGRIGWIDPIRIRNEGQIQGTVGIFPSDSNEVILGYYSGTNSWDSNLVQTTYLDPYVQKINSDGLKLWADEGLRLRIDTTKFSSYFYKITSDNSKGVFCFWHFFIPHAGLYTDKLYIQHISKDGIRLWGENGLLIADSVFSALSMKILTDDSGGIFVLYHQNQNEFYIENYDSTGTLKWRIIDGLVLEHSKWVKDGDGGIIISSIKEDYPNNNKLILHRISNTGARLWGENGVVVDDSMTNINPESASIFLNSDSSITALWDNGWYPLNDLFVQRLDLFGNKLWDINILVSDVISSKVDIGLLESEMNSNILIWDDLRTPKGFYAQRIEKSGTKVWGDSDRAITNLSPGTNAIISDGNNGAIVIWADDEPLNGILAQQISKNGNLGEVLTSINDDNYINTIPNSFSLFQNYPNPFNPSTKIIWQSPVGGWQTLKVYDILGKEISTLVSEYRPAGKYEVNWNAANLPSGVYIYTMIANGFSASQKMLLLK